MEQSARPNIDPSTFIGLQNRPAGNEQVKNEFDTRKFLDTRLKEDEQKKKVRIRVIPFTPTGRDLFFCVRKHSIKLPKSRYSNTGWKNYLCYDDPHNQKHEDGQKCPLCAKREEYTRKAIEYANEKKRLRQEVEELSKSAGADLSKIQSVTLKADEYERLQKEANLRVFMYTPKDSYIIRVIDRDHEKDGPKFYTFNSNSKGDGVLDKMLTIYNERNEESMEDTGKPYNVFDLYDGRDLTLHITRDQNGHSVVSNITDGSQKPLSEDKGQVEAWVNDPTRWNDLYTFRDYGYLDVVANGYNPYFNKNTGKWEAWTDYTDSEKADETNAKVDAANPNQWDAASHWTTPSTNVPF